MRLPAVVKSPVRRALRLAARAWLRLRSRPLVFDRPGSVALVIAPHPDDEAFGCGGVIALRRERGLPVHIAYLTDGSASHPGHPTMTPWKLVSQRILEARAAMGALGVSEEHLHFLCAPDGLLSRLPPLSADSLVAELKKLLDDTGADEIFIPSRHDASAEHMAAHALIERALNAVDKKPRCYEYTVWSWWNPRFLSRPALASRHVYRVARGLHTSAKARAIRLYQTQVAPVAPWPSPLLSPEFLDAFTASSEYFFES